MNLNTARELLRSGRLRLLMGAMRLVTPYYRLIWLAAACRSGLIGRLHAGPLSFDELAAERVREAPDRDWLRAWLALGVRIGELRLEGERYSLRGYLARQLALPANDSIAAIVEEVATLHHTLVLESPRRMAEGRRFTLADQDGVLVARSSPLLQPFVQEAIDEVVPARGAFHLLEVGAGSATYIRYAAERNPELRALGVELQPEVADFANANLRQWGLAERARVEPGDVRDRKPEPEFDLVTFHNNVYYFPVDERVELLRLARGFLRPGGSVLFTTACSGGSPTTIGLDIWSAGTERCGRLPAPEELVAQMREAGFADARARSLFPGDRYYAFFARRPG